MCGFRSKTTLFPTTITKLPKADTSSNSFVGDSQLLPELKAADLGLFGATMWPEADWERLEIVTYLAAWVCAQ